MTLSVSTRVLAAAVTALSASWTQGAPPPVEAFGRKPAMIAVDINPAGTRLAWIEDDGNAARIVIHDIASGQPMRTVGTPPKTKLWSVAWANDDTVLIDESVTYTIKTNSRHTDEWQRWVALDAAGGEDRMLLMRDAAREWVTGAAVIRRRTTNPGKIFMSTWDYSSIKRKDEIGTRLAGGRKDSGWILNAYEVDLRTGAGRVIASGTSFTTDWLIDEAGKTIVRSDYNPKYDEYTIFVKDGAAWRRIYRAADCDGLSLVSFVADKSALVAHGRACADDRAKLWTLPLDGGPMKALFEDPSLEVDSWSVDPFDGKVLGVALGGLEQVSRWLDPQVEKRIAGLHRSFGARWITIASRSADGKRVVVLVEDESHPPIYYLVDYAAKKADIIYEAYPQLTGVKLGAVRAFAYEARDKYALTAYLTLPPGAEEKNLPVVIMPHGGPEARDAPGFDWLAQFLASRGYAVLQPQFRGSTGLGRAHADAGRRQWGLRMQDDVTDGAQALISQGIADPKKICIIGWSYGGYAALAGAAFTPDLYACAASIAGISDLPEMIGQDFRNNGGRESNTFAYWREHIGNATDPQVIAKSPARSVKTVRAPVLLIHGTDDTVVPIAQSLTMARALEAANKPVKLVQLPGEDHWMKTRSASRVRTLVELETFLGQHLGKAPASPASAGTR